MTRVVCISDTHAQHRALDVPAGDILIHAGDFTNTGEQDIAEDFGDWFSKQPHKHKFVIPGNHEIGFDKWTDEYKEIMKKSVEPEDDFHILVDEMETAGDHDVFGTPWSPNFFEHRWAFNQPRDSEIAKLRYRHMYDCDPDIVISHTPPYGILDKCPHSVGCEVFLSYLHLLRPKLVVCGHIHEDYGIALAPWGGLVVNACSMTGNYRLKNKPIVVNI